MNIGEWETEVTKTTRPPLERMQAIHNSIAAGRYPNCRTLGRSLAVAPRTVQRDIEFMKFRLALPIAYDAALHGYCYTEYVEAFLTQRFNTGEVSALRHVLCVGGAFLSSDDVATIAKLAEKISALGALTYEDDRVSM